MREPDVIQKQITWNWFRYLSDNTEKLLREFDQQFGSGRAVAILHPEIAAVV